MKPILLLLLSMVLSSTLSAQTDDKSKTVFKSFDLENGGRVAYGRPYKMMDATAEQVLSYGVGFMNVLDKEPILQHDLDRKKKQFTFTYSWYFKWEDGSGHCLENTTFTADVVLTTDPPNIYITNILYDAPDACGKKGEVEDLRFCKECRSAELERLENWLSRQCKGFTVQYKYYLRACIKRKEVLLQ
jgi:hypothetical protein